MRRLFGRGRLLDTALRYRDAGQPQEAVAAFERYLARAPDDIEARRMCADLLVAVGETRAAVAHYLWLVRALIELGLGLRAIAT